MNILFRADASAAIGTGHVMRCLALAQACRGQGAPASFLHAEVTPTMAERLRCEEITSQSMEVLRGSADDAEQTIAHARTQGADWIIADGYDFDPTWQSCVREAGLKLLVIDDYAHLDQYDADVILNQNAGARRGAYTRRAGNARLWLGSPFAMLRREFLAQATRPVDSLATGRRVLVTLGGSDPENVTARVLHALALVEQIDAVVVVGGSSPHRTALEAAAGAMANVRLVVNPDMPAVIAAADVAIAAGGGTMWELAHAGVPFLTLAIAGNQLPGAKELHRRGIADHLGFHSDVSVGQIAAALRDLVGDRPRRERMSLAGRKLIDGRGAERVATRLLSDALGLRRATPADAGLLWNWVNEPAVRRSAFNQAAISWTDHQSWFAQQMANPACTIFIAMDSATQPIGQIRFEQRGGGAEIDVSVDVQQRGRGLGAALIARGVDAFLDMAPVCSVEASIKPANTASLRAFERAGFQVAGSVRVGTEEEAIQMVFRADD